MPPDLEFVSDGATVGKFYSRARATLCLSGVILPVPFAPYSAAVFVGAANERADGRCPAVIRGWEETFRALGFGDFGKVVRQQVAGGAADGALVRGGPEARHSSTAAMNNLWPWAVEQGAAATSAPSASVEDILRPHGGGHGGVPSRMYLTRPDQTGQD